MKKKRKQKEKGKRKEKEDKEEKKLAATQGTAPDLVTRAMAKALLIEMKGREGFSI